MFARPTVRRYTVRRCLAVAVALCLGAASIDAQDWPRFRGPNGDASSDDTRVPIKWSDTENMRWKLKLPGEGFSSPIVVGDFIYLTCYSDKKDLANLNRHVIKVNRKTGEKVWQKTYKATHKEKPEWRMARHGYASHTPISDGERLYVVFGASGVFCLDLDGNELWQAKTGTEMVSKFGSASSPILHGDTLIVTAGNESKSVFAFDKMTGKQVWKTKPAKPMAECYTTPRIVKNPEGQDELLVSVPRELWSLNPKTGKLRWYCETEVDTCACPSLLVEDGIVYVVGGRSGGRSAIKIGGSGDVTKKNTLWSTSGGSYVPSPVLYKGHLYWVKDDGTAYCVDAKTGKVVTKKRIARRLPYYASVVRVGDKLIAISRFNGTYVLSADPKLEVLAHNTTSDKSDHSASPAVSDGTLIYRSDAFLYCVGAPVAATEKADGDESASADDADAGSATNGGQSAIDWARFRGPGGSGVAAEADVPAAWGETKNLRWKCALPGRGYACPIVVGDKVIVSCYAGEAEKNPETFDRHLVAVARDTGKIAWTTAVPATTPEKQRGGRAFHGYATHTPATDGERIYVLFGNTGVIAFDLNGKELWRKDVGHENNMRFGSGASPIVFEDLLIVQAGAESKMIWAFKRATGEVAWKTKAVGPLAGTYCTPVIVKNAAGDPEMLISVPYEMWSLNPRNGKLNWYADTKSGREVYGSVIASDGIAYVLSSQTRCALKIGGKNDVTKTNTLWSERGGSGIPSPALHDGKLFWVNDRGTAFCVDAKTGKELKKSRVRGGFYASCIVAGDKLIAQSRFNGCYVLSADAELKQLAHNKFDDDSDFSATPAACGKDLFIRSDKYLYCVRKG